MLAQKDTIELYGDGIGKVQLVQVLASDLMLVNAARVSFGVEKEILDQKDEKLINYLIEHKHTSVLEHCFFTFKFTVPLFIRSQHHRHRTWSYNEISRRYTEENIRFFEPKEFRTQHKSNRQASNNNDLIDPKMLVNHNQGSDQEDRFSYGLASFIIRQHHISSINIYNQLLESGVCREQARGVLPQNMYTEYYGSVNLNNLFKFIDSRTHEGAQKEIQDVAKACLTLAEPYCPVAFSSYRKYNKISW